MASVLGAAAPDIIDLFPVAEARRQQQSIVRCEHVLACTEGGSDDVAERALPPASISPPVCPFAIFRMHLARILTALGRLLRNDTLFKPLRTFRWPELQPILGRWVQDSAAGWYDANVGADHLSTQGGLGRGGGGSTFLDRRMKKIHIDRRRRVESCLAQLHDGVVLSGTSAQWS